MIEDTKADAIVVFERGVRLSRGWTHSSEGAWNRGEGKHHGAPDGGVAEAKGVAEFVGEKGFEIVGFRVGIESERSGETHQRITGIEIDVGVEDLADLGGWRAAAELDADLIGGDDAS